MLPSDWYPPERDPTVLVEALERIVEGFFDEPARVVAREALAEWNARQPEVVSRKAIHKAVGDIVDGDEMWSAYDVACAVYALLTKSRGGAV